MGKKALQNIWNAPKSNVQFSEGQKSKGILDDSAVRGNVATKEGTIEHVPTADNHIANKKYIDDAISAIPVITDYWKTTTAQTGVTGDKAGSFDITTTGDITTTNLTADTDTLVVGSNFVTITGPSYPLCTFERQVSGTSGAWAVNRYIAKTSGNMGNTFGPAFTFTIKDSAEVDNDIVIMNALRDGSDTSGRFQIRTKYAGTYNTAGFNIDPQNRVGIGTINPSRDIHLYNNTDAPVIMLIENPNTGSSAHAGFKLANDLGNTDGAVCVFYPSTHATAANVLYYRNYEGDIKFLAEASSKVAFGAGSSIADATDLVVTDGAVDVAGDLTAGTMQADNGFTGTGAYTNFTIVGGIITAAS